MILMSMMPINLASNEMNKYKLGALMWIEPRI